MKKTIKTTIVLSSLMFGLLIGVNNTNATTLATTLKGKILLQVEQNGEAWYVNPVNELRYYLGRPADAFNVMRELGLGISNKDFDSFNGYAPSRLSGRILLKVVDSGKAYYVNTNDLKMYYLGRPVDAFNIMRELGLGITDKNLSLINRADNETANWQTYKNEQYEFEVKYPGSYSEFHKSGNSSISLRSTETCKSLVSGGGEWPIDCQAYDILVQQNRIGIAGGDTSKTFVAGIQAEKFTDSNGMWSNGTQVLVQFQKGQNWYIQTFTFNQGKSQIAESVMNQILSTFKFTK